MLLLILTATRDDLMKIAELILNSYLSKFDNAKRDVKLFRKIMELWDQIPFQVI